MLLQYLRHIKDAISLKELLEDLRYAKRRGLRDTAKRVLRVFDEHQIPVTRIPQIFPEFDFKFSDFDSLYSIINVMTPDLLDRLSAHFFVNREWLDTGRGEIQQQYESGYDFKSLYNLIQKYEDKENQWIVAYFVVEDGIKFVPANDHDTFGNLMVILEHTTMLNDHEDFEYKRYQPLYFGYWHYYKTRMMIKSLSLLFIQSQSILSKKGYFSKYLNDQIFQAGGILMTIFSVMEKVHSKKTLRMPVGCMII